MNSKARKKTATARRDHCGRDFRGSRRQPRARSHLTCLYGRWHRIRPLYVRRYRRRRAVHSGWTDAGLAWRTFLHGQSDCTEHDLRRDYHDHPVFSVRRGYRRAAPRNIGAQFLVRLYLFRSYLGPDEFDFRDRPHHRTAHVPELYHRAISHAGRGKPLRAFCRHCRINRGSRAARRGRHPSLS